MWKKKGRNGRGEKNGWKERGVKEKEAGRPGRRRKIRGRKEWEGEGRRVTRWEKSRVGDRSKRGAGISSSADSSSVFRIRPMFDRI